MYFPGFTFVVWMLRRRNKRAGQGTRHQHLPLTLQTALPGARKLRCLGLHAGYTPTLQLQPGPRSLIAEPPCWSRHDARSAPAKACLEMVRPFHWLWFPTVIPVSKDPASLSLGEPASNPLSSPSIRRSPHRDSNREAERGAMDQEGTKSPLSIRTRHLAAHTPIHTSVHSPIHSRQAAQPTVGIPCPGPRPAPPLRVACEGFPVSALFSSFAIRGRNFCL